MYNINKSKQINMMKTLMTFVILVLTFASATYGYPQSQMEDCISSASSNPATKTFSKSSITSYCDCALTAIFDENKDIRKSGYECAKKSFN